MAKAAWQHSGAAAIVADLEAAWQDRLSDARALVGSLPPRPAAAIAAALYALEIRLKVLVCKNLDLSYLPTPVQIHDPRELLVLSGLSRKIDDPVLSGVKYNWEQLLPLADQINDLHYKPDSNWPISQAQQVLLWLDDPDDGVLTWLSTL